MGEIAVSAERIIPVPADRVYAALADYKDQHHKFLPSQFTDYEVEEGGVGEGTVVSFNVTLGGRTRPSRAHVTEPEPGRVLVETEPDSRTVTTFTLSPEGQSTRVQIRSTFPSSDGLMGYLERLLAPRLLRGVYSDELTLLANHLGELD